LHRGSLYNIGKFTKKRFKLVKWGKNGKVIYWSDFWKGVEKGKNIKFDRIFLNRFRIVTTEAV